MVRFTKRYKYSRMNGGKKKRRKTQKNKRRKHRKGGMNLREKLAKRGIQIPIGKQLPFSKDNQPKEGDNVRVHGEKGWTVTVVMPRAAMVCRTDQIKSSEFGKICGGNSEKTVRYENMTKRGSLGQLGLRGGRKKRRKSRKKSKKRRRKTKRRMKGGSGVQGRGLLASPACSGFNCDLPSNAGEIFTKYSNNNNPFFPDPMSLNRNVKNPISPKPMTGAKKGGKRKGRKSMKGGFFFDDWGLGDGLLAYYKGTNAALNTKHLYAGNKPEVSATPSDQPELLKKPEIGKTTPNVPRFYNDGSIKAASFTV